MDLDELFCHRLKYDIVDVKRNHTKNRKLQQADAYQWHQPKDGD
jgi:hypothetical protein